MPAMLRDILEETLATQADMRLVGSHDSVPVSSAAIDLLTPDVLVIGVESPDWISGLVDLFRSHPLLRVLAIRSDGRRAVMHELSVRRYRVSDLSPSAILSAVRASAADAEDEANSLFRRERP